MIAPNHLKGAVKVENSITPPFRGAGGRKKVRMKYEFLS